ncbi:MAG: hypothetical protein NT086_13645 [Proteobacteria bacterium]|nr:hypothetical protein [Pseudomonadota bacterium]
MWASIVAIIQRSLPSTIGWFGGSILATTLTEILKTHSVTEAIEGALASQIVEYALVHWGVILDRNNPLSKASINNAISQKVGFTLTDVFDKNALMHDVGAGLAQELNQRFGTHITTVWPVEVFQDQLENAVLDIILEAIDDVESEVRGRKSD